MSKTYEPNDIELARIEMGSGATVGLFLCNADCRETASLLLSSDDPSAGEATVDLSALFQQLPLFAAAPDLLAALQDIAANLGEEAIKRNDHILERITDSRTRAQAAIAQAESEAQHEETKTTDS